MLSEALTWGNFWRVPLLPWPPTSLYPSPHGMAVGAVGALLLALEAAYLPAVADLKAKRFGKSLAVALGANPVHEVFAAAINQVMVQVNTTWRHPTVEQVKNACDRILAPRKGHDDPFVFVQIGRGIGTVYLTVLAPEVALMVLRLTRARRQVARL